MAVALLALIAQFGPDDGPDPGGDVPLTPVTLLVILGAGFAVGGLGHLIRSRALVLAGVLLVFAAVALLPIAYRL